MLGRDVKKLRNIQFGVYTEKERDEVREREREREWETRDTYTERHTHEGTHAQKL